MPFLTIITPTYNRAYILKKVFNSLNNQTCKDFIWMIVDDGSQDNTKELVDNFEINSDFEFQYIYKSNGGKHTALNKGISQIKTELTMILDSDDYLTPDAIETIYNVWVHAHDKKIFGMSFLKGYTQDKVIGGLYPQDTMVGNYIDVRINNNIKGDKAEVWKTNILKNHPWPEYENEKFMPEGYVWGKISQKYDMIFINKIIYIAEYLEDGLTKSGRKLRIESPLGGMENSKLFFTGRYRFLIKVKNMMLYICYGLFAKKSIKHLYRHSESGKLFIFSLLLGVFLYMYWKIKYL